jgi:hypothetical protein
MELASVFTSPFVGLAHARFTYNLIPGVKRPLAHVHTNLKMMMCMFPLAIKKQNIY